MTEGMITNEQALAMLGYVAPAVKVSADTILKDLSKLSDLQFQTLSEQVEKCIERETREIKIHEEEEQQEKEKGEGKGEGKGEEKEKVEEEKEVEENDETTWLWIEEKLNSMRTMADPWSLPSPGSKEGEKTLGELLGESGEKRNDEGHLVAVGRGSCNDRYYCGRHLGRAAPRGSDGQCGPNDGPPCQSCKRFGSGVSASANSARRVAMSPFQVGDLVLMHGLVSDAGRPLNGVRATIHACGISDHDGSWYECMVADGSIKRIRTINLKFVEQDDAKGKPGKTFNLSVDSISDMPMKSKQNLFVRVLQEIGIRSSIHIVTCVFTMAEDLRTNISPTDGGETKIEHGVAGIDDGIDDSRIGEGFSFLKFLSIAFVRQLSSGRSLQALEVAIRPLQVALRKRLQMDTGSEAASHLRQSMQAFATIQLFRLEYGEDHGNFAGIETKLPPASLELCLWLIRVLAEDGRKMFSHLTLRAINFALWKHDGKTKLSLLHTTTEMLTKISPARVAKTCLPHLKILKDILEQSMEPTMQDEECSILMRSTTECLAVLIPLLHSCQTAAKSNSLRMATSMKNVSTLTSMRSLTFNEKGEASVNLNRVVDEGLKQHLEEALPAFMNLRSFTNDDGSSINANSALHQIYKDEVFRDITTVISSGNLAGDVTQVSIGEVSLLNSDIHRSEGSTSSPFDKVKTQAVDGWSSGTVSLSDNKVVFPNGPIQICSNVGASKNSSISEVTAMEWDVKLSSNSAWMVQVVNETQSKRKTVSELDENRTVGMNCDTSKCAPHFTKRSSAHNKNICLRLDCHAGTFTVTGSDGNELFSGNIPTYLLNGDEPLFLSISGCNGTRLQLYHWREFGAMPEFSIADTSSLPSWLTGAENTTVIASSTHWEIRRPAFESEDVYFGDSIQQLLNGVPVSAVPNKMVRPSIFDVGDRVVRGPTWKWGSQDGGPGNQGTVTNVGSSSGEAWYSVEWANGNSNKYRGLPHRDLQREGARVKNMSSTFSNGDNVKDERDRVGTIVYGPDSDGDYKIQYGDDGSRSGYLKAHQLTRVSQPYRRCTVGDKVLVDGRRGVISRDDHDSQPYKVIFTNGDESEWKKAEQVQLVQEEEEVQKSSSSSASSSSNTFTIISSSTLAAEAGIDLIRPSSFQLLSSYLDESTLQHIHTWLPITSSTEHVAVGCVVSLEESSIEIPPEPVHLLEHLRCVPLSWLGVIPADPTTVIHFDSASASGGESKYTWNTSGPWSSKITTNADDESRSMGAVSAAREAPKRRCTVGDKVSVDGRRGEIIKDDHDSQPYRVRFTGGDESWFKVEQVQLVEEEKEVQLSEPINFSPRCLASMATGDTCYTITTEQKVAPGSSLNLIHLGTNGYTNTVYVGVIKKSQIHDIQRKRPNEGGMHVIQADGYTYSNGDSNSHGGQRFEPGGTVRIQVDKVDETDTDPTGSHMCTVTFFLNDKRVHETSPFQVDGYTDDGDAEWYFMVCIGMEQTTIGISDCSGCPAPEAAPAEAEAAPAEAEAAEAALAEAAPEAEAEAAPPVTQLTTLDFSLRQSKRFGGTFFPEVDAAAGLSLFMPLAQVMLAKTVTIPGAKSFEMRCDSRVQMLGGGGCICVMPASTKGCIRPEHRFGNHSSPECVPQKDGSKEEEEVWTLRTNAPGWRVRSLPDMTRDNEVDTKHNGDDVQVVRSNAGPDGKWLELANGA